jgi:PAS domain S-box-containing protein
MVSAERDSGIDVIGRVPWGTHFCFFFETREDLASVLVPFFEAGLKNNEYCVCVTSKPLEDGALKKVMRDAVPGFNGYLDKGQIEFISYEDWYYDNGTFNLKKAFNGWLKKLQAALASGYDGIRITGSVSWLKRENWKEFIDYENEVNNTIGNSEMLAICTYPLDMCDADGIVGAVSAHQFALVKQNGEFKLIENSELKETKKALRESEAMLSQIIDTSPIPMVLYNEKKANYFFNKKFAGTFGYTIEDVPGINEWWTLAYPDEKYREFVKKRWYDAVDEAIKNRASIAPQEAEVTCKDGSKKYILGEFSSIGSMNLAVLYDITERKRAEEELKAAKAQAELYLDLMGHDINNMHQVALGYLELARDLPAGEEQAMFLDKPVEVLQRSTKLISNVKKLQKLRDGMFQDQDVDVCEVLRDVQREFGAVPHKAITLNINGCEQCLVHANELLHDVFANLVSNAIKHTGDRTDIIIDMDVLKDKGNKYCRVMIEDDGPGIPDDFKATIFNRTLKGTSKAKGMGLGLYLAKTLVDSYGGQVWVEDRVIGDHTKGARFVVMLPEVRP